MTRWKESDLPDTCIMPGGEFTRGRNAYKLSDMRRSTSQGLTLVISPLIALMKDQVDALVARGVKAANLDSTLSMDRATWVKDEVLSGSMKILYVAPERYVCIHEIDEAQLVSDEN